MTIFDEPKIDCHNHVIDPLHFPYIENTRYRPSGQEIGTALQFRAVMRAYGVKYALVVQPTSGYGTDNRCMLDALARGGLLAGTKGAGIFSTAPQTPFSGSRRGIPHEPTDARA